MYESGNPVLITFVEQSSHVHWSVKLVLSIVHVSTGLHSKAQTICIGMYSVVNSTFVVLYGV